MSNARNHKWIQYSMCVSVCLCVCVYETIISKEELVMNLEGYKRNISDVADIIPDTIEDIIIHNFLLYFRVNTD